MRYLVASGWQVIEDPLTGQIAGAKVAGPYNDTIAACETGFCKTEFSLAHVANLFELTESIDALRAQLTPFTQEHNVRFLGYGIQPLTPPSQELLFKKARSCFWEQALPSNQHIPPADGDDVHLFTINAGSHVHVSIGPDNAARAVNVLNGFAGPQIALTAHSPIWQGRRDERYLCVNEKLWDWWEVAKGRVGVPARPFKDLEDYVRTIENLAPIYVKRSGQPVLLPEFEAFGDYYSADSATGRSLEGEAVPLVPKPDDIRVHNSCYWYTARISQYFTVENRVFDQQPPDQLESAAALTLGLVTLQAPPGGTGAVLMGIASPCSRSGMSRRPGWRNRRIHAGGPCRPDAAGGGLWVVATTPGGREVPRTSLRENLRQRSCPATRAKAIFDNSGIDGIVEQLSL